MSDMGQRTTAGRSAGAPMPGDNTRVQTGWVGWVLFAGSMLVMLGCFHVIQGLVALLRNEVYAVTPGGLVVNADYTAWGWTHLIGGGIAILVGGCLLAGQMWARIVAVLVALISAVVNVAFLPAYPIWSAMMVGIDILIIWAVTFHGSEVK
jgi:hypothetical protein